MNDVLQSMSTESMGAIGVLVAVVLFLLLWKLFKMAVKTVLFVVVMLALAAGVAVYLERGGGPRTRLPVTSPIPAPPPARE